jgi:hypothetical protein
MSVRIVPGPASTKVEETGFEPATFRPMSVAASGQGGLMVRVDPAETDALLGEPHPRPFETRGRRDAGLTAAEEVGPRGFPASVGHHDNRVRPRERSP